MVLMNVIARLLAGPTAYARYSRWSARAVLAALVLLTLYLSTVPAWTLEAVGRKQAPGQGDTCLYLAVVQRVHHGEGYYAALGDELRARNYPTRSVFNWRMPLPLWLIGKLPAPELGMAILGLLALALACVNFEALARDDEGRIDRALLCMGLLVGPLLACVVANMYVMPELWSGVWLTLSIGAYGVNRRKWGVGFGLAALACRELALPYCLLAAAIAAYERRGRECAAWAAGLTAWGIYLTWQWSQVQGLIPPDARGHPHGWICLGGARFVLATVNMNAFLLSLPTAATAAYFVAAMVGFAGWRTRWGIRAGLTAAMFVAAFAVVGQQFNQYWGFLITPLLCLGAARFPSSLADLVCAAGWWICPRHGAEHSAVAPPAENSGPHKT